MSTRITLIFFAALLILQTACTQNNTPLISGKIKPNPSWKPVLYLVKADYYKQVIASYEGSVVDSAAIATDGSFQFEQKPWLKEKGIYMLFTQPVNRSYKNEIAEPVVAENYICLVLGPGSAIQLSGNPWELSRSYRLEQADADNRMLAQLRGFREPIYHAFEVKMLEQYRDTLEQETHGSTAVQDNYNRQLENFLDTTRAFYPAIAALRLRTPENEFRDRPEYFIRQMHKLDKLSPGHPWIAQLGVLLDPSKLPVLEGEIMPDFALPTPAGDTLHLKDVRSKLLLVDFWASWCAPCRSEIRETIRPLYAEYHDKGFNVIGVSIDAGRDAWVRAIQKDGATWPNVSDLLGDASPVRQSLKFDFIPNNYLLDENGRLLARNVHREELRKFVEEYLRK